MAEKKHYRSVFVSDFHLGAVGAKAETALEFLASVSCDHLYLVGDIIDGWVGRKDRKWTPVHADVIRQILQVANEGCEVFYTPGNHDAFMRRMHGVELGNIKIAHSFEHVTADGKDLLVVHGDLFDRTCTKYQPVAFIGAWMYEYLGMVNAKVNKKQREKGRRPVDFTTATKRGIKKFIGKTTNYEASVSEFAKDSGYDGVVCGHIHRPMVTVHEDGFVYVNSGDFVENCTAVVEHEDGRLELLRLVQPNTQEGSGTIQKIKGLVAAGRTE